MRKAAHGQIPGANVEMAKAKLRYLPSEVELGKRLKALLGGVEDSYNLPDDPEELAKVYLSNSSDSPQAQGIFPLLIIGGGVLVLTSFARSWADKAKFDRQMEACEVQAAACPFNWNKWLMVGAVGVGLWFLWTKTNVLKKLKG